MDMVRKALRYFAWSVGIGFVAAISGLAGLLSVIYAVVLFGDDSYLHEKEVKARITEETAIYMLDEQTKIGSVFASSHRTYIPIDQIPEHMINAMIASEDKNFMEHSGVDPVAIVSAATGFIRGGRIRGASTLTQQTVRNILGWWEVTLSRKFREWIAAMQLERLYSKREILEFYLNQFYVSGNGNGVGIAARYYFNKDVADLSLEESAFIAGSVKGPSTYDPFIKFTREQRERAVRRAFERKNYVLNRMHDQGFIDAQTFQEASARPVKFNRGRFRSSEVALTQLIKKALRREEILEALNLEDAREIAKAGLKVYTTIDPEMQEGAQLAMRRNLSRLETMLSGFEVETPERFVKLRNLQINRYYYAQVTAIGGTKKEPEIEISFGLPTGKIPYDSLMRRAKIMDLPYGIGWQKQLKKLMRSIKVGDVLFVEVLKYDVETHEAVAELHRRPRVNGGMIALDKGEVRCVVSGFDTKGFNRAISAKRQPGSVFKPLTYFAALQLGWSVLDPLDNQRQVFPYQGNFYYPRPDHQSPYAQTSMLWAGVLSENLASINLAFRLVEKLKLEQFKMLLGHMGLLPERGESARDYHYRVSKEVGVSLDHDGVREFQLRNAIDDLLLDIGYTATAKFQSRLKKIWWGRGYANEMQVVFMTDPEEISAKRKAQRIMLLKNNFLRMQGLQKELAADWEAITALVESKGYEEAFLDPAAQHLFARFRVLPGAGNRPALGYYRVFEGEPPQEEIPDREKIEAMLLPSGRMLNELDIQAIWAASSLFGGAGIGKQDVLLGGWMPEKRLVQLAQYVEQNFNQVNARQEDYDLHRYWQHHDFRIGVGLEYLVRLTKSVGVRNKIQPILSFPLGTNDVTTAEVAKIYQTLISGKLYRYYEKGPINQLNFIRRIEDRYGNVLFEPMRREYQLVRPEYAYQMREILRRVVTHGTGRRARGELFATIENAKEKTAIADKIRGNTLRVRVPAFGKTGTTNDYSNAYFAGSIPYPTTKNQPLDPDNSNVIAAYVGYDLNKKMQAGYLSIAGASGALPAWINLAKTVIESRRYSEYLDNLDAKLVTTREWPLQFPRATTPVRVDMPRGVVMSQGKEDSEVYKTTNIEQEGEVRFNEFRAAAVNGTVHVPMGGDSSVLRMFAPFAKIDPEDEPDATIELTRGRARSNIVKEGRTGSARRGRNIPSDVARVRPPDPQQAERLIEQAAAANPPATADGNDIDEEDAEIDAETDQPEDLFEGIEGAGNPTDDIDPDDPGFVEEDLW